MPLLNGIVPFKRVVDPPNATSSDTKLFYIHESGECFASFGEMMERLTLVHSNVWTCEVTRKHNLTLEEAFLSEKEGHKGFPNYGQQPFLFVGYSYFKNASFTELVYGTYKIIRGRYFLNEYVRYHAGAKALFGRVIEVIFVPPDDDVLAYADYGLFPVQYYKYVIEYFDHIKGEKTTVCVSHEEVSRSTSYSSRNSIFKYFSDIVEKDDSRIVFKKDEIERLNIEQLTWKQIFVEPEPFKGGLKRKGRPSTMVDEEETKAEELAAQSAKRAKLDAEIAQKVIEPSEWDKYRATEKEVRHEREKLAEERLKLWKAMELSEDLDLNDLKMLPQLDELTTNIPSNELGDVLNLYGFLGAFGSLLDGWDLSFTFRDLLHAIYANEHQNKPLLTLACCLIRTRNVCVSSEDFDEADIQNEKDVPDEYKAELTGPFGDEIKSRNLLLERLRCCHGASLFNIEINDDSINQHIIYACHTAGYCPRQVAMDVRKELRGELSLSEDELFNFSLENKDILDDLERMSICELAPSKRLKLLSALHGNLLSYGDFRKQFQDDMIEMKRLTQRLLKLSYLEQQYESDYADTVKLMETMFPDFKLKRNGHSKKVDETINTFLTNPTAKNGIYLTQMKTRFDYVEPPSKREELRKIQHNVIELRSRQIEREMSAVYKRLGCAVLGTDRVFRQYTYVESLSLIFVEGPLDNSYGLDEHCKDTQEEEDKFQSCTSEENCPIHSCYSEKVQWFSLTNDDKLSQLMSSFNQKGLREGPLLANLKVCVENVRRSINSMPDVSTTLTDMFQISQSNEVDRDENYYKQLFCVKLLEFEEKLNDRFLLDEKFVPRRLEWRTSLQNKHDTRQFCPENGIIFDGGDISIFDRNQLKSLESAQILGISLFQIANSLILECLKEPFVDNHRGGIPIATTTFAHWIQSVCNVTSINELFFFLTSIGSAIKWSYKIPKSAPCTLCGTRGSKSTMIKCSTCSRPFHRTCVKSDQFEDENWSCSVCVAPQAVQSSRRRSKPKPGHFLRLSTVGNL